MRPVVVLATVIGMVIGGGIAYANHRFPDVLDSSFAHDAVSVIADRGITLGCGGGDYCPEDPVTREEMAAFLERAIRVATPVVITKKQTFGVGNQQAACATAVYTPTYEQQVVFSGGIYGFGYVDAANDAIAARIRYRADGGSWADVTGTFWITDGSSAASNERMAAPVVGALALNPGVDYEFSLNVTNSGNNGGCQLTAVITNRMPGQSIGTSSLSSSSANPDDSNN